MGRPSSFIRVEAAMGGAPPASSDRPPRQRRVCGNVGLRDDVLIASGGEDEP
jgi:hypothetical protein